MGGERSHELRVEVGAVAGPVGGDERGGGLGVAVGEPGGRSAVETAGEAFVADLVRLPDGLAEVLVVVDDEETVRCPAASWT